MGQQLNSTPSSFASIGGTSPKSSDPNLPATSSDRKAYTANKQTPFKSLFCHTFQNCIYSDFTTWAQISIEPPPAPKNPQAHHIDCNCFLAQTGGPWPQWACEARTQSKLPDLMATFVRPHNWELAQNHGNPPVM